MRRYEVSTYFALIFYLIGSMGQQAGRGCGAPARKCDENIEKAGSSASATNPLDHHRPDHPANYHGSYRDQHQ